MPELINDLKAMLESKLPSECQLYLHPYFNGLKPDLVLLHSLGGINLVFIEKLSPQGQFEVRYGPNGNINICIQTATSTTTHKLPIWKLELASNEINKIYGPRLRTNIYQRDLNTSNVTVCILCPNIIFAEHDIENINKQLNLCNGYILDKTALKNENFDASAFLPQQRLKTFPDIGTQAIADLRNWVNKSEARQIRPINLSEEQRRVVDNEDKIKRRRIKGGPGAGKTEALLGRTLKLCAQNKEVLYLTYNLTLINEVNNRLLESERSYQTKVTIINFHEWCRRLSIQFGFEDDWNQTFANANEDQKVFENSGQFIMSRLSDYSIPNEFKHDAVIVDETQDMCVDWIRAALLFLRPGGELLLAADTRQDVYFRSSNWTSDEINGLGFSGPWLTLKNSHRTPAYLVKLLNDFKQKFLDHFSFEDMPNLLPLQEYAQQLTLGDKLQLQESSDESLAYDSFNIVHKIIEQDKQALIGHPDRSMEDIVILVPTKKIGQELAAKIIDVNIRVETTFNYSGQRGNLTERDLKIHFSASSGKVKISTIHSFKGMSSSRVVLVIKNNQSPKYKSEVYVGISRLKSGNLGNSLFLVSSNLELNDFFKEYI